MASVKRKIIVFHAGGLAFHPVDRQAQCIAKWLGQGFACDIRDGAVAFDNLADCDLLVIMGLHYPGMDSGEESWHEPMPFHPLNDHQKRNLEEYVASGRPILAHHGGIASYFDWPRFGQLVGFIWDMAISAHSPYDTYTVEVLPTGHPVIAGVSNYQIVDEIYYNIQIAPGLVPVVHACARWEDHDCPMVMTAEGDGVAGGGRRVYLANGHDMRTFVCPTLKQLWINSVHWLLQPSAYMR